MTASSIPLKRCSKCGKSLPKTTQYFYRNRSVKDGFQSWCINCQTIAKGRKAFSDRPKAKEGYHFCGRCGIEKPFTKEYFGQRKLRSGAIVLRKICRECKNEQHRNSNRIKEYDKKRNLLPHRRAKRKIYSQKNRQKEESKEYHQEYNRLWKQTEQGRNSMRVAKIRYRASERYFPSDFTAQDWQRAVDYFHGCCAACGRQLIDLFNTHTAHADHWIPLSHPNCPGTIPTNIVPLCGGENGCNNSKGDSLPLEWLERKFGKHKARKILKQINAYFDWVREIMEK